MPRIDIAKINKGKLAWLKREIALNSVRLFLDAHLLYQNGSFSSALALAISAREEIGKLNAVDHIIDDICLSSEPKEDEQEYIKQLFKGHFFNHERKQFWAEDLIFGKVKPAKISELEYERREALYTGFGPDGEILKPRIVKKTRAKNQLKNVKELLLDGTILLGFNSVDCRELEELPEQTRAVIADITTKVKNVSI